MRVAGIMSGTSLDGIDVAIVDITGRGWNTKVKLLAHDTRTYPASVRTELLGASNATTHTATIARLNALLGHLYADAAERLLKREGLSVDLIGCHGQTIYHQGRPEPFHRRPIRCTYQIGEPAILAARLHCPVVSNFRQQDMAVGGQGAPLVPYLDYLLFRHRRRHRVSLNIGGIANVTVIPAAAIPEQVIAFDTGPGNMVMDQFAAIHSNGKLAYDRGGKIAARGTVSMDLLQRLLQAPYYRRRAPKSAGREEYGPAFVALLIGTGLPLPDLIATATELTAQTIARALLTPPDDLIIGGGGAHNPVLLSRLQAALPQSRLTTTAEFGIDPDAKEAVAFAVMAYETWHRRPSNIPSATGASHPVILGQVTFGGPVR